MSLLQVAIAVLLVLMTILPLSVRREWWIRAMDFPSLQLALAAALWLIVWLFQAQNSGIFSALVALAVFAVFLWQFRLIYPYTELSAIEVDGYLPEVDSQHPTLKLLVSNVLMSNRDSSHLLGLIKEHEPDIFISLESDHWWQEQFESIAQQYPHSVRCPLENLYGMHLYSRIPLDQATIDFQVEKDKPSIRARAQVAPGNYVQFYVVHPAPPAPFENIKSTERDVELIRLAYEITKLDDAAIVAGDLNDVPWSATTRLFRHISGFLDPRIGRGLFNTFNVFHWFARWPLDHILVTNHFKVIDIKRLPAIGSDHYPLLMHLAVTNPTADESLIAGQTVDAKRLDSILTSSTAKKV